MQTSIQEAMPPEFGAAPALRAEDHIRLDKTRVTYVKDADGNIAVDPKGQTIKAPAYSTIHSSERTPDDPYFKVSFMQDGLPFDSNGNLVPDDGRTAPFTAPGPDGKPTVYLPLWTDTMRKIRDKKLKRVMEFKRSHEPIEDDLPEDVDIQEIQSDMVQVEDWLMGGADYRFDMVQKAIRRRFNYSVPNLSEAVRCLVYDVKLMAKENVADKYKRFLNA